MDEKLQAAVAEMIGKVNDGVDASTAFLSAELPDYISQLLMWIIARDTIVIVLSVMVIYLSYMATFKWSDQDKKHDMWRDSKLIASIIGGASSIVSVGFAVASTLDVAKIILAPKVWLVEYAASLAK